MFTRALAVVQVLALSILAAGWTACGGMAVVPQPDGGGACATAPCPTVSPEFAGTWRGDVTVEMEGAPTLTKSCEMLADVEGDAVTVYGVCPDGTGSITLHGAGASATWAGSISCSAPVGDCPDAKLWLSAATIRLDGSSSATLAAQGKYVGCGEYVRPVGSRFVGGKTEIIPSQTHH